MNEYTIIWLCALGGSGLVVSSTLYTLGGRKHKALRRWVGAFILALTVNLVFISMSRWSPWYIGIFPLLVIAYSLGYGASAPLEKVIRRTLYALAVLMNGLLCAIVLTMSGSVSIMNVWTLFTVHVFLCGLTVFIGVRNPIYAASEEFLISMLLNLALICYPFVGG